MEDLERYDTTAKKMRRLLNQLEAPSLDSNDLKNLALACIADLESDSANSVKVKLEAIRLIKDIMTDDDKKKASQSSELGADDIMSILKNENFTQKGDN